MSTQLPQASASTNSAIRAMSSVADEESQETRALSSDEASGVKFQSRDFSKDASGDSTGKQTRYRQENDRTPAEVRFWRKVTKADGGCWEWMGFKNGDGYGQMNVDKAPTFVHRYAWTLMRGPIPAGLTIDHLCRNTACVNPEHLEPVTLEENSRRAAVANYSTHCIRGHEFTEANTRIRIRGGARRRVCRPCALWHFHETKKKNRITALRALAEGKS